MDRNEELRLGEEGDEEVVDMDLTSEEKEVHAKITKKKRLLVQEHRMKKNTIDQLHKKLRVMSNSRSRSRLRGEVVPGEGFKDYAQKQIALKIAYKSNKKRNKQARKGEADRTILNLRPKHLFSGKRRIGKTNRR